MKNILAFGCPSTTRDGKRKISSGPSWMLSRKESKSSPFKKLKADYRQLSNKKMLKRPNKKPNMSTT